MPLNRHAGASAYRLRPNPEFPSKRGKMHIRDALDRFVVQLRANGRSEHTVAQYRRHVRSLARWLAEVGHGGDIADIGHEDLARFLGADTAQRRPDGGR